MLGWPDQRGKIKWVSGKLEGPDNVMEKEFEVINTTFCAKGEDIKISIALKRLNMPYWLFVLIPSTCLVIAAEITLFIDKSHFKASITVTLTVNLAMFTLYNTVKQTLPADPNIKLIDAWLIHGILMPITVFIILVANELLEAESAKVVNKPNKNDDNAKSGGWIPQEPDVASDAHAKTFQRACQIIVPSISLCFILIFFVVGLYAFNHYDGLGDELSCE